MVFDTDRAMPIEMSSMQIVPDRQVVFAHVPHPCHLPTLLQCSKDMRIRAGTRNIACAIYCVC